MNNTENKLEDYKLPEKNKKELDERELAEKRFFENFMEWSDDDRKAEKEYEK